METDRFGQKGLPAATPPPFGPVSNLPLRGPHNLQSPMERQCIRKTCEPPQTVWACGRQQLNQTPTLKHGDFVVADFDLDEFEAALERSPEANAKLGLCQLYMRSQMVSPKAERFTSVDLNRWFRMPDGINCLQLYRANDSPHPQTHTVAARIRLSPIT